MAGLSEARLRQLEQVAAQFSTTCQKCGAIGPETCPILMLGPSDPVPCCPACGRVVGHAGQVVGVMNGSEQGVRVIRLPQLEGHTPTPAACLDP